MNKSIFVTLLSLFIFVFDGLAKDEACWITVNDSNANKPNTWIAFRKDILLKRVPSKVLTQIAVDSKYWLWINGKQVVFEGGLKRGPTPQDTYYDELDIAPYLKKGENRIAVLLWYFGKDGFSHNSSGKSGLLFGADALHLYSDESWRSGIHPAYSTAKGQPQPNYRLPESNICFVAEKDIPGWQTADISSNPLFQPSVKIGQWGSEPWNKLVKRPIPFWKDYGIKTASYKKEEIDSTIVYTLPLSYNMQLTPVVKLNDPDGNTTISICTDHLYGGSDTNVRAEYVTCKGEQSYESLGWMNGEQLIVSHPKDSKVQIQEIGYRETGYDAVPEGKFFCDNDFFMRFWEKALRTLYVNMRDTYFDCPDRERAQWWGDVVILMGESFYTYSVSTHRLMRKAISELVNWQREDKTMFSPVPAGNYDAELPAQMLASIGMYGFWNYYMNTGDEHTIRYVYPHVRDYLSVWQLDEIGLTANRDGGWAWGDWGEQVDIRLVLAAWHYLALEAAVNMAELTGHEEDVETYQSIRTQLEKGFNRCWNGRAYRHPQYQGETDDRVQALAVLSGLAGKDKYEPIFEVLGTQWYASPYMEKYVMEALFKMGQGDYAMWRMKERFAPMVNDTEHTTLFEGWEKGGYGGGSTNHAWSGGALTVIAQYLCGIVPIESGYNVFKVAPCPVLFKHAAIEIPTVKGTIASSFKCNDSIFVLELTVPKKSKALVVLPEGYTQLLQIDGRSLRKAYKGTDEDTKRPKYLFPKGTYKLVCRKK